MISVSHLFSRYYHYFFTPFFCIPLLLVFIKEKRLTKAKQQAEAVVDHVSGIPRKDASSRDVALIHFFMLENVHWFYRMSLRLNLLGRLPAYFLFESSIDVTPILTLTLLSWLRYSLGSILGYFLSYWFGRFQQFARAD